MPRVKRRAFKSSNYLKEEELQIIRLRHTPQDRMIRCLLLHLDLPQLAVRILCRCTQHPDEQLLGGKVGAAGSCQIAAAGQQLHGTEIGRAHV